MMLLATVSLRNVSRHLVGPYKQPYRKTLSLYWATYAFFSPSVMPSWALTCMQSIIKMLRCHSVFKE